MNKRTVGILAAAVLVGIAAAGGWWWLKAGERQSVVASALPPTPELQPQQSMLEERLRAAEQRARSRLHAQKGLAELAQVYHANGFLDAAVRCYETLQALEPDNPRWKHYHATIVAGYGEIEPALALWRRVVELAPDYTPARLRLGDSLFKANQFDEAAAVYAETLRRKPDEPHAQLGLARIDYERNKLGPAQERLERIVSQTNFQLGYDMIVAIYERTGQTARAAAVRARYKASGAYRDPADPWLNELLEFCYDPYRLSLEAGSAGRDNDTVTARRLLERAIELAPADVSARFQLGSLCRDNGDLAAAREHFTRCTVLAPKFSDGWARLSDLCTMIGDRTAADRALLTGLAECPESPALHLLRARRLREVGNMEEAVNHYMISARLRPNEPDAYAELGNMLIGMGREEEGIAQLKLAIDTDPANPLILGILTFHAISTGDRNEAEKWLARVAAQPRVPTEQRDRLNEAFRERFGKQ